uniref:Glutathione S-transferase n=1 Tax=Panagrolaimus sp. ES5 TaxID=591445 RepID=A0AC34FGJ4_9BILA
MVQYKVTYFDIRGLGETTRLILRAAGVDFEDNRVTFEQWGDLKSKTPTGKLPLLEVDGKQLPESGAINRFLAAKHGLRPKCDWENAQMESAVEYFKDFSTEVRDWFRVCAGMGQGDKDKLYKEVYAPAADRTFARLTDIISKTSSGFLVDSGLSWGDFFLAESILTMQNFDTEFGKKFPKMVEYQKKVHSHEKVKDYISKRKESKF